MPPANQGGRSAPNGNGVCVACGQQGRTPCDEEPVCNPGFTLGVNGSGDDACLFCGTNCPGSEGCGAGGSCPAGEVCADDECVGAP